MKTKTTANKIKHGTITFNKGDWSGKDTTIRFYADGSFELYEGDWFQIVFTGRKDELDTAAVYRLIGGRKGRREEHPVTDAFLNVITPWNEREYWTVGDLNYHVNGGDLRVAVAQYLYNVI